MTMHPVALLRHPSSFPRWTSKTERTWRSFLYQMERLDFMVSAPLPTMEGFPAATGKFTLPSPA